MSSLRAALTLIYAVKQARRAGFSYKQIRMMVRESYKGTK